MQRQIYLNTSTVAKGSADHGRKRFNVNLCLLSGLDINKEVVVLLLRRLAFPIQIRRIASSVTGWGLYWLPPPVASFWPSPLSLRQG